MTTVIALFLVLACNALEGAIYTNADNWRHRKILSLVCNILIIVATSLMLYIYPQIGSIGFAFVGIYKVINNARIFAGKLPEKHIKSLTERSYIILTGLQLIFLFLFALQVVIPASSIIIFVVAGSLIGSVNIFISTIYNVIKTKPKDSAYLSDAELPTLTVAIAARNETPMLTECLERVTDTDYPKLEILVLDDNSQDTTADIIKSFAQKGVRFVHSEEQPGTWLAKNKAYQTLLQHASGEFILFMGVDVRLIPSSLRSIVEQALAQDSTMMTIVPKRTRSGLLAAFIQPMRYWWEFAIPRFLRHRPPALSTTWIAKRKNLEAIGGFATFKRSIIPEEHLARLFDTTNNYSFIRSTKSLPVTTQKVFASQWDTQVRTRYPHAHRRPENALTQTFMLTFFVITPFILLPFALFTNTYTGIINISIIISVCLYLTAHVVVSLITNPIAGFLAPVNFPIAIALDIITLHVSMYKYEFSKVIWKGRDVSKRKLKAISHLPELSPEESSVS